MTTGQKILRMCSYFRFDPLEGTLYYKNRGEGDGFKSYRACMAWNGRNAGRAAGGVRTDGYVGVGFDGGEHLAHRIIWEMHNGPIPDDMEIDHIDGNRSNNTLPNLRVSTRAENSRNAGVRPTSKSGVKGVIWNKRKRKWSAQITVNGVNKTLGYFDDPAEASKAYNEAADLYHKEFARHSVASPH